MRLPAAVLSVFGFFFPNLSMAQSPRESLNHEEPFVVTSQNTPPVLRTSPEFIIHFIDGKEMLLSSTQGKVVALVFVHTGCPLCQRTSQILTKLSREYSALGFLPIDVAFDSMANLNVSEFVRRFGIGYQVGLSSPEEVREYLNLPADQRYNIPRNRWIDAKGKIRSQTPLKEDPSMLTETYWRNMIECLLKESTTYTGPPS